jgi:hypothetical protein
VRLRRRGAGKALSGDGEVKGERLRIRTDRRQYFGHRQRGSLRGGVWRGTARPTPGARDRQLRGRGLAAGAIDADCGQTGTPVVELGGQSPTYSDRRLQTSRCLPPCKFKCRHGFIHRGIQSRSSTLGSIASGRCTPRHTPA